MLQSMGSQRVGLDWVTELNWTELIIKYILDISKKAYAILINGRNRYDSLRTNSNSYEIIKMKESGLFENHTNFHMKIFKLINYSISRNVL